MPNEFDMSRSCSDRQLRDVSAHLRISIFAEELNIQELVVISVARFY